MINFFNANAPYVPEAIAFRLGSLEVAWYGIFIFIGFAIAIIAACIKLSKWYKIPYDPFFYFTMIGIPTSILGARLWSFIIGDAKVVNDFFREFWLFENGGLAIQGGIIFTIIAALIYFPLVLSKAKYQVKVQSNEEFFVRKISIWVYADAVIPCILIGQIIGRWGNFFNQEVYGALVENPEVSMGWLKSFMPDVYYGMFIGGNPSQFHQPLFLYESFGNFFIFLFLFVGCEFIKFRKAGDIGILYFLFYGILRLIMEPFRSAKFAFVTSIVISALFIIVAIILLVLNHLVFFKNRNRKILYQIWIVSIFPFKRFYSLLNKEYHNSLLLRDPELSNYGFKNKIDFIRKDDELMYYNNY
ncbi:MAG: prolipoprotein diacylglyceryl transferase [Malacoplasma sp.]